MKKNLLSLVVLLFALTLFGCGSSPSNADADVPESSGAVATDTSETDDAANEKTDVPETTESAPVESEKDFNGDSYSDTGDGVFLVVTAGGNSESGNVPVVYAAADTSLLQIGYETTGMNGGSLSYVYIDGVLLTKEQLSDSQGSLDLSGNTLAIGVHKVEVVQYENDATDATVTTYKTASYEIKEK